MCRSPNDDPSKRTTNQSRHTLDDEIAYWTPERMKRAQPLPLEQPEDQYVQDAEDCDKEGRTEPIDPEE